MDFIINFGGVRLQASRQGNHILQKWKIVAGHRDQNLKKRDQTLCLDFKKKNCKQ